MRQYFSRDVHDPSMNELHSLIDADLRHIHSTLSADGTFPSQAKLQEYYDTFRREFGPEVLRSLDGQALLQRMHAHGNRESLVYWLEFKDDDEFPAIFGSISGGSALKFGVYRRAETATWATKGVGSAPKDISVEAAIEIARRHRDQLLAAIAVIGDNPPRASDEDYLRLQRELRRVAPDVEDTVWGHKYLSLLFPQILDDFHVAELQRYHLARLLQVPPREGDDWAQGRYVCAGRYVALSRDLDIPLHDLATVLKERNGPPRTYWRIGTTDNERERRKYWPLMRDGNLIAVGWQLIGDLSSYARNQESKDAIAVLVSKKYPSAPQRVGKSTNELFSFVTKMVDGDRVIVADGQAVLGIAEVAGPYSYDSSAGFPHQHAVAWKSLVEWQPMTEGIRTSVKALKDPHNLVKIERHILEDAESVLARLTKPKPVHPEIGTPTLPTARAPIQRLSAFGGQLQSVLERKGQAIVYGPPGTGKTFWSLRTARDLAAQRAYSTTFEALGEAERRRVVSGDGGAPLVRMTTFHPEYGYEDFIEGYRPSLSARDGSLTFSLFPGAFRRICVDAAAAPALDFFLIIDEINRGDVPRIFGELLTLLEHDKRGEVVTLPLSGELFRVPSNVFVIGTMNTADRSIALLDIALRRRFGFVELMPDYSLLDSVSIAGLPLGPWLRDLNRRIRATGGGDARNRQVGHAFFLVAGAPITTVEQLSAVLRDDLVPLLEEYCYDDFAQVAEVIGQKLIDVDDQRVRRELFEAGRGADLIAALLRPEIATATRAVMAAEVDEQEEEDGPVGEDDGSDTS